MSGSSILQWIADYEASYKAQFGVSPDQIRLPLRAFLPLQDALIKRRKDSYMASSSKDPLVINGVLIVFYGRS